MSVINHAEIFAEFYTKDEHKQIAILNKEIEDYIKNIKSSPAQRTPEWYKLRETTIGGSEIAVVIGANPYENSKKLIMKKAFPEAIYADAMSWGTMMELVTLMFAELVCSSKIQEAGSLEGIVDRQRYSPDGLGVVEICGVLQKILFEFKAPVSTKKITGVIPSYYMPQVQTGMVSIPWTECTIFIANCYTRTTLANLINKKNNDMYCSGVLTFTLHNDNIELLKNKTDKTIIEKKMLKQLLEWQQLHINNVDDKDINALTDLGSENIPLINFLQPYANKLITINYHQPIMHDIIKALDIYTNGILNCNPNLSFIEQSSCVNILTDMIKCDQKDKNIFGYMTYELQKTDVLKIDKVAGFRETLEYHVKIFLEQLDTVLASDNRMQTLDELFAVKEFFYNTED